MVLQSLYHYMPNPVGLNAMVMCSHSSGIQMKSWSRVANRQIQGQFDFFYSLHAHNGRSQTDVRIMDYTNCLWICGQLATLCPMSCPVSCSIYFPVLVAMFCRVAISAMSCIIMRQGQRSGKSLKKRSAGFGCKVGTFGAVKVALSDGHFTDLWIILMLRLGL